MTYTALSRIRKQSVSDVEQLFSPQLGEYMHKKGYTFEAEYVTTIRNWRRLHDERGLTQLERCKYNYQMLNFILTELLPWHKSTYDFSTMEVNM